MRKIKVFLKDLFSLVTNVRQLENDVENLENKVLAPEDIKPHNNWWPSIMSYYDTDYRQMTLEEKVNAIAKVLKIKFEWIEEKDKEVIAKIKNLKKK